MTSQEIADIFAAIELELIGSLKQLLNAGKTADYSSFKMQTLRSIEAYRKRNSDIWIAHLPMIEEETAAMLEEAYEQGVRNVQVYHDQVFPEGSAAQTFAGVNAWRMDSLIEDVNHNLHTAQTASLRMMEDVYRDVVYKAEIHHATGAITVRQAVDRAVKEFLERGINCIEYKDGRRVNIATYAEMALRTASLRSRLRGEAAKRRELGVDTVLVSQYGACSDTCLPWQGRVYIDDVWGNSTNVWVVDGRGQSLNGKWYPLLSEAVEGGLFHPNCRHDVTTWYEGISRMPTPLDVTAVRERSHLEQRQRELERKVRKWKRLEEGSQTPENVAKYKRRRLDAQKTLREFVREHDDVLRRDYWREKTYDIGKQEPATDAEYMARSRNILANQSKTDLTMSINDGTLTEEDLYYIDQYKKSGVAYSLNYTLRNGEPLSDAEHELIRGIDTALSKLPTFEGTVYRSVRTDTLDDPIVFELQHTLGEIVLYDAYTSTSEEIYDDTMEYQLVIKSKRGRDMRQYNPLEKEILFMRGSQFLVTKRVGNTIYMEEI